MLRNILGSKVSSSFGLVLIVILILKLVQVDLATFFGYSVIDLSLYISGAISSFYHFISKDHDKDQKKRIHVRNKR